MFYFSKMQATGNDFIIIDYLENKLEYSYKLLAQFLCDRHYGVGSDGLLVIEKSLIADIKMRIFNKDGSEAEMCGNGIRCLAKYVYEKKIVKKETFYIETLAGIRKIKLNIEGNTVISIEVEMGTPIFDLNKIPVIYLENNYNGKIHINNFDVYPVSIGNPHAVCFVNDIDNFDVKKYGKMIEEYKYFPNKINVEFVEILDENKIKIRVWERGNGETYSCGTGACASAVICSKYKSTKSELTVELLGGKLEILYDNFLKLRGSAENIFEGKIFI